MKTLHLLFSHSLTEDQKTDARESLQITDFRPLPDEVQRIFSDVPPRPETIDEAAELLIRYLSENCRPGDYALIQGDFGMVYRLVNTCKDLGVIPVYATTERRSEDVTAPDGSIHTRRIFKHIRFRVYK